MPFDLGGGWSLDVGVHNGEARLGRSLFSIPSFGPEQALELSYSSLDLAAAGPFGYGWRSNLTQTLTAYPAQGLAIWTRADGGRVAFSGSGSSWTTVAGHYETLSFNAGNNEYTVTTKDRTALVFEALNGSRLKRIVNRFGKALTLTYPTNAIVATDAAGRTTTLTLTGSLVTAVADSAGRTWTFIYAGSDLAEVREPLWSASPYPLRYSTRFGYVSHGLTTVTRTRDRAAGADESIVWTIGYTAGRVSGVLDPIGAATSGTPVHLFTYGPGSATASLLLTYPAPVVRNATTYTLDGFGRPTAILDPDGYTTRKEYSLGGDLTALETPITTTTSAVTTFGYDTKGNLTLESRPEADAADVVTTVMTYDPNTNDLWTRSENDNWPAIKVVTLYRYDTAGHLLETIEGCTSSGTIPPADASTCTGNGTADGSTNLRTTFTYTAHDEVDVQWNPRGIATRHTYDANGNETATIANCTSSGITTPPRGSSCTAAGTHDATTNVTTAWVFDLADPAGKAGLPASMTDPAGAATTYAYDALGRAATEALPGDATIPALTRHTDYDGSDNPIRLTESWPGISADLVTTSVYDLRGRKTDETDPAGNGTHWSFDAAGNEVATDLDGVTTSREFDHRGNATSETVGSGGDAVTTLHTFDGRGNEITTQPSGSTVTRTLDLASRILTATVSPTTPTMTVTKDYALHTGVTSTTTGYLTETVTVDRLGRSVTRVSGSAGTVVTASTVFDANGNAVTVSAPHTPPGTGVITSTTYDALDRPTLVVANDVATPTRPDEDLTTGTFYDAAGRVVATVDPAGVVTRTFYNVRGLAWKTIANCTDSAGLPPSDPAACPDGGPSSADRNIRTTLTYDGLGHEVSRTIEDAPRTGTIVTTSEYDPAGNQTKQTLDPGGLALVTEFAYASGRQVAVKDPRGTITRSFYDTAGRVTTTVLNCTTDGTTIPTAWATCAGTGTADGTFNVTTTHHYDSRGNTDKETAPNGRETWYAYDAADRVLTVTQNAVSTAPLPDENLVTTNYYDAAGNLAAVQAPTASRTTFAITRYVYDDLGRKSTEIRNCVDTAGRRSGGLHRDRDEARRHQRGDELRLRRARQPDRPDGALTRGADGRRHYDPRHAVRLRQGRPAVPGPRECPDGGRPPGPRGSVFDRGERHHDHQRVDPLHLRWRRQPRLDDRWGCSHDDLRLRPPPAT